MNAWLSMVAVAALLGDAGPGGAPPQVLELTIGQAVERALKNSPRLKGAGLDIAVAEAKRKQARAQFGPKLQFELRAMFFDEPPSIGGGAMSAEDLAALQQLAGADLFDNAMLMFFQELPTMFESEPYDVNVTARVVQPLTPLWAIYHLYKLSELEVDVARVAVERQRSELAYQVRETCLRLLQAEAGLGALDEAIKTVEAHIERARFFLDAGLISKNDLLQAEVRLADLKGRQLGVHHGALLARASLAMLLDEPATSQIRVKAPMGEAVSGNVGSLAQVQAEAAATRPELRELDLRILQAERGVKAAWQGYIPTVAALAQYQHNEGSIMAPPTWTGGLVVDFNVWEWGATHYSIEEAEARLARARTGRQELVRGIDLQVQAAWLKLQETAEKIQIARSAVVQATEQVRLERERYEAQQNTSTDVLDAQTRLTQARVTTDSAEIEHRISLAALDKAIGRLPGTGTHHRAAAGSPAVQESP